MHKFSKILSKVNINWNILHQKSMSAFHMNYKKDESLQCPKPAHLEWADSLGFHDPYLFGNFCNQSVHKAQWATLMTISYMYCTVYMYMYTLNTGILFENGQIH